MQPLEQFKPADVRDMVTLAKNMTLSGGGGKAGHARRAFELAHHARRFCEMAAEYASRNRWDSLEGPKETATDPDQLFSQLCAERVIKYPVRGEAAVYAVLLATIAFVFEVSQRLYAEWLETQPKEKLRKNSGPSERLGSPMAQGCRRVQPVIDEDEDC